MAVSGEDCKKSFFGLSLLRVIALWSNEPRQRQRKAKEKAIVKKEQKRAKDEELSPKRCMVSGSPRSMISFDWAAGPPAGGQRQLKRTNERVTRASERENVSDAAGRASEAF